MPHRFALALSAPLGLVAAMGLASCTGSDDTADTDVDTAAEPVELRVASFNVALFGTQAGRVASSLGRDGFEPGMALASILQTVRPDVVLLNELDWDTDGDAVEALLTNYITVPQGDLEALDYPHIYQPTVNTGLASGVDLDGNGTVGTTPGTPSYGGDAFGFGEYEGQYGMVILSRYPIDTANIRTFQTLRWTDMPNALLPVDENGDAWLSDEATDVFRLSSKTHADVPILVGDGVFHALISHPTPPSFDGDEDRNGRRNHDEVRLWVDYISGDDWMTDDSGVAGGLGAEPFVILGDLNNDPNDGDSLGQVITDLLAHPRVNDAAAPTSEGGAEQSTLQAGVNADHIGDPATDTADFRDTDVGNLRLDYAIPSNDLTVVGSGVFWPTADDPAFEWVGTFPFPLSDHRLVWVDVVVMP